jgi:hypothetical protein
MFLSIVLVLGFSSASFAQEDVGTWDPQTAMVEEVPEGPGATRSLVQLRVARQIELRTRIVELVEKEEALLKKCERAKKDYTTPAALDPGKSTSRDKEIKGLKKEIDRSKQVPGSEEYIALLRQRLEFLDAEKARSDRASQDGQMDARLQAEEVGNKLTTLREELRAVEKAYYALISQPVMRSSFTDTSVDEEQSDGAEVNLQARRTPISFSAAPVHKLPSEFKVCFPYLVEDEATASADN